MSVKVFANSLEGLVKSALTLDLVKKDPALVDALGVLVSDGHDLADRTDNAIAALIAFGAAQCPKKPTEPTGDAKDLFDSMLSGVGDLDPTLGAMVNEIKNDGQGVTALDLALGGAIGGLASFLGAGPDGITPSGAAESTSDATPPAPEATADNDSDTTAGPDETEVPDQPAINPLDAVIVRLESAKLLELAVALRARLLAAVAPVAQPNALPTSNLLLSAVKKAADLQALVSGLSAVIGGLSKDSKKGSPSFDMMTLMGLTADERLMQPLNKLLGEDAIATVFSLVPEVLFALAKNPAAGIPGAVARVLGGKLADQAVNYASGRIAVWAESSAAKAETDLVPAIADALVAETKLLADTCKAQVTITTGHVYAEICRHGMRLDSLRQEAQSTVGGLFANLAQRVIGAVGNSGLPAFVQSRFFGGPAPVNVTDSVVPTADAGNDNAAAAATDTTDGTTPKGESSEEILKSLNPGAVCTFKPADPTGGPSVGHVNLTPRTERICGDEPALPGTTDEGSAPKPETK